MFNDQLTADELDFAENRQQPREYLAPISATTYARELVKRVERLPAGSRERLALMAEAESLLPRVNQEQRENSIHALQQALGRHSLALSRVGHPALAEANCVARSPLATDRQRHAMAKRIEQAALQADQMQMAPSGAY